MLEAAFAILLVQERKVVLAVGWALVSKVVSIVGWTLVLVLELELIQTHMIQKPMLRVEVCTRALRASQNVKKRCVPCVALPLGG